MVDVSVAGAGGMIGGHLVNALEAKGWSVRAVDIKPIDEWYQRSPSADNQQLDLTREEDALKAVRGVRQVYQLASDMGGVKFITDNSASCLLSSLITTQLLVAAQWSDVERFLFTSSACVYQQGLLTNPRMDPLLEADAYPADPETDYGWEKLFSERMCQAFRKDRGLETRIARLDTTYGTHCTYFGGREKVPAAICRKVAAAKLFGEKDIEVWGDGEQTRAFLYVDDTIDAMMKIMNGPYSEPVNVGASDLLTIDQLVTIVEEIANVSPLRRKFNHDQPVGARGRILETSRARRLGWVPTVDVEDGMERLFGWVHDEMAR